jgi:hypothetical protein
MTKHPENKSTEVKNQRAQAEETNTPGIKQQAGE